MDDKMFYVLVTVNIPLTPQDVDDIMASALDGVDCEMIDSVCADEIVQYALFDEVIFG